MKMKLCAALLVAMLLALPAMTGMCDSLYVDNREENLAEPERLNLRAEPSTNSAIVALYYTGAEVENLGAVNDAFTRVQIGGVTGYMVSQYLTTWEDALARHGEDSVFGECRAAQIDLTGMWKSEQPLLESAEEGAANLLSLHTGDAAHLIGIVESWAYIAVDTADGASVKGYVPLDTLTDVGVNKVSIVAGARADGVVTLYDLPNSDGVSLMELKNGTACFALFGRGEGTWRRVRVGGVSGWIKYTQVSDLVAIGNKARSAVPYYPLLMQTKGEAKLYSRAGNANAAYMTMGEGLRLEVLAEVGDYAYVRTCEGGEGAYDSGDFGYVALSDLTLSAANASVGVAQMDDGDLPVLLMAEPNEEARQLGALCAGAQVHIADYTQTNYVQVTMGDTTGYVRKTQIRVLGDSGVQPSERIPQRAKAKQELILRAAPGEEASAVETVAQGERVYMLGVVGKWAFVRYADAPDLGDDSGAAGFVPLAALEAPASTTHLTAFVNTDKVNMRDREDKSGEIIARARLGECLRVADYGVTWCCVVTPDGKRGYIMTEYLEFG